MRIPKSVKRFSDKMRARRPETAGLRECQALAIILPQELSL
ncbi:hypothetical protein CEV33_1477 [Brucella grignonensis]|uniref:Uncharacterized protein n=1 Tax=Brucella grignonensis TaxID=94627 RepID=A0A256FAQ6_9HYPH|nr:hypothetical protein CEV33_1477 [Brucella grignonensis]